MPFSSTANDLTTLAALKAWIGIPTSDTAADAVLSRLITSSSNFILSWLGRAALISQSVTEKYDGNGGSRLFLKNFPVTAVASVKIADSATGTQVTIPIASVAFGSQWVDLDGFSFTKGSLNVEVTYTAGYTVGASYELLTLEQACLELCHQKWNRRKHVDESSRSLDHQSTVFSQRDMPAEVKTLLRVFESVVPA